MCGLAGILRLRQDTAPIDRALLQTMADQVAHRGPDDQGHFVCESVGLAHRRLSIVDIDGGHQPMSDPAGAVTLVFNGEIFNYIELRQQLRRSGVQFRTESDTEVVIQLYLRFGMSFVDHLNGQFAIALWDHPRRRLILARDRVGICPLYYTRVGDQLIFASEVKALLPALPEPPSLCSEALDSVFTFWTPISPQTVYKNISSLAPGYLLVAEQGKTELRQYWDWVYPGDDFSTDPETVASEQLVDILDDATRIRLRSDVPVGAYLSGGLDSSALVRIINRHARDQLTTFSLRFDQADLDESRYQDLLVQSLDTSHRQTTVNADNIAQHFTQTIRHIESPILRSAPVAMGMLSSLVHDSGFKVVLTGEGADEALGGYDLFKEAKVRWFWARQPDSPWRPLLLKRLYPYLNLPNDGQATYLKKFFGRDLDKSAQPYFSHLPRWQTTAKIKQFYSDEFNHQLAGRADPIELLMAKLEPGTQQQHRFNQAQYIESKTLMSEYLLSSQGDRVLMKHSVEGRFPFLDHRFIEFANRLHPNLKMKVMNEKYLLKKAMATQLPEAILSRKKQPYRAPDLADADAGIALLDQFLCPTMLADVGVFDPVKVGLLRKKAATRGRLTVAESQALTAIVSTQVLHQQFIARRLAT